MPHTLDDRFLLPTSAERAKGLRLFKSPRTQIAQPTVAQYRYHDAAWAEFGGYLHGHGRVCTR